jgi:hypothetical protein
VARKWAGPTSTKLAHIVSNLVRGLLNLFLRNADGWRPSLGSNLRFQHDPAWRDSLLFYEYFHGDTGDGLGASHQTRTALAAALVANRRSRRNKFDQSGRRWSTVGRTNP